jgi:alpha-L-fucosidase
MRLILKGGDGQPGCGGTGRTLQFDMVCDKTTTAANAAPNGTMFIYDTPARKVDPVPGCTYRVVWRTPAACPVPTPPTPPTPPLSVPLPTASQLQWQQYEIGVIIHYNMETGKGQGCGIGGAGSPPASSFEPAPTFDATEWMETSSALGAKYAVYVAKHECGFCTWKTEAQLPDGRTYPYAVGGPNATTVDVVASFVKAARAAGIVPGFYYSISENTYANGLHLTEEQSIALTVAQLAELWDAGAHGDLAEVWFDGGWRGMKANISGLLASAQPKTVAFNGCNPPDGCIGAPDGGNTRWIGTEAGVAPDPCWSTGEKSGAGDPNSTVWNPGEADTTLQNGDNWFWNPSVGLRTLAQLTDVYVSFRSRSSVLVEALPPASFHHTSDLDLMLELPAALYRWRQHELAPRYCTCPEWLHPSRRQGQIR